MAWRKWKLGIVVAVLASLLVAGAGIVAGMKWQAFIAVFCSACLTHCGTFLRQHPIESIEDPSEASNPPEKK